MPSQFSKAADFGWYQRCSVFSNAVKSFKFLLVDYVANYDNMFSLAIACRQVLGTVYTCNSLLRVAVAF